MKNKIYGIFVTLIFFVSSAVFLYILGGSEFLTGALMTIAACVLLVLAGGIFALTFDSRKKVRTTLGTLLAIILVIVQLFADYYVILGAGALAKITRPALDVTELGVYVRVDDKAQSIEDAKGYNFGVLEIQDRENTDKALKEIEGQLNKAPAITTFDGLENLMVGLLDTMNTGAIVLNKSFLPLLEDISGHKNDEEKIREIFSIKIEAESVKPTNAPEKVGDTIFAYISGIDTRGSISNRSRSDVNILAAINVTTGQILLISTPRDYYVPLPISNGVPDKLTHAGIYGIEVSKGTLEKLYGVSIDYYFRVNFDGFKDIVDALDGVTVKSDYDFKVGNFSYKKGANELNGEQALAFARARYNFASGDRQRGKNQMAVIQGVIDKATSPKLLTNFKKILDSLEGSFETDMPYKEISKLVRKQLKDGTKWNMVSYSVDGTGASRRPYSMSTNAYVMIPNKATVKNAKRIIKQVEQGKVPRP